LQQRSAARSMIAAEEQSDSDALTHTSTRVHRLMQDRRACWVRDYVVLLTGLHE